MIYSIFKVLAKLTVHGYFRKISIEGKENIPTSGPYLFVANHPSAFMDPIVIATAIKPSVHFIAAGEYVGKGIKGWFFKRVFHMIPVYRPSTRPGEAHKNKNMFEKCYEHISNKGALLIFPEGVSLTELKLKPLKTGAVRIAIGAEEANDYNLNVPIIPIGLNYSDPHSFRSDLYIKIAPPLYPGQALSTAEKEDKSEQINATKRLTAELQTTMQSLILHLGSKDEELMLQKLNKIYSRDIKTSFDIAFDDQKREFELQKDFEKAINYFKHQKPELYYGTEDKIDKYLQQLDELEITDKDVAEFRSRYSSRRIFSFILGAPYFLTGLLSNYIPYRLTGLINDRIKIDKTFTGSMALAIGMILFLLWYTGLTIGIWLLGASWFALFSPIIAYISGVYALMYSTAIRHSLQRIQLRKTFAKNKKAIIALQEERQEITTIIQACKEDYLKATD